MVRFIQHIFNKAVYLFIEIECSNPEIVLYRSLLKIWKSWALQRIITDKIND